MYDKDKMHFDFKIIKQSVPHAVDMKVISNAVKIALTAD